MVRVEVAVVNRLGLHARAAARLAHLAHTFDSRIRVGREGVEVDGKSILGLLTLAAARGVTLHVLAEGSDEAEAARRITALVASGFEGED